MMQTTAVRPTPPDGGAPSAAQSAAPSGAPGTARWHILAVDDEPLNLDVISTYLDDSGFMVDLAESAEVAWDMFAKTARTYDLVLLDRVMPGMDGLELLRRMKATPTLKDIPVIMQTSATEPEQVREGIEAGAFYYLTKPFEGDTLVAIVRAALIDVEMHMAAARRVSNQRQELVLSKPVEFRFATIDEACRLAGALAGFCPQPEKTVLGLTELMVNAIEHGNLEVTYSEKSRLKFDGNWAEEIGRRYHDPAYVGRVARVLAEPAAGEIRFTISDEGPGFDWVRFLDFDPERAFDPNGRGIAMARLMSFQALRYEGRGNIVTATVSTTDGDQPA